MASAIEHYRAAEELLIQHDITTDKLIELERQRFVADDSEWWQTIDELRERQSHLLQRAQVHATLATTRYAHMDVDR